MGIVGFESAPRYRELLYKLISEDLEFPPPGFILELDRPEWRFLKDELLWQSQVLFIAAVAAQSGFVQVLNPIGSGRLVTVLGFVANKAAAGVISTALTSTVRGATGGAFAIATDTRWNSPIVPAGALPARDQLSVSGGTSVAFGADVPIHQYQVAGTFTQITLSTPVILAPGTGFVVSDPVVNEAINVALFGYSRQARPEELVP